MLKNYLIDVPIHICFCYFHVHNYWILLSLAAMVTSKVGKRHALSGFEALKELFLQRLGSFLWFHESSIFLKYDAFDGAVLLKIGLL